MRLLGEVLWVQVLTTAPSRREPRDSRGPSAKSSGRKPATSGWSMECRACRSARRWSSTPSSRSRR